MAKVLYSLAQEGKGHSSRGCEVIRRLAKRGHSVLVLTGGDSFQPLAETVGKLKGVRLRRMPGFKVRYHDSGQLDLLASASANARTFLRARKIVRGLERLILREKFDLVISDFEPFTPRAARNTGTRFVTLDNQHRFVFEDPEDRIVGGLDKAVYLFTREAVKDLHPLGSACIITSSFRPRLNLAAESSNVRVESVGPIIREEVEALKGGVKRGNFILSYVKKPLEKAMMPILLDLGVKQVIYVSNPRKFDRIRIKGVAFRKHSARLFARDLARCRAVIGSAGEQLMSEALYLGKPLFLMAEKGTFEQRFNAELVRKNKVGDSRLITEVTLRDLQQFLQRLPSYEERLGRMQIENGIGRVMEIIDLQMPSAVA